MNRSELIDAVATRTGLATKQAELVIFSTLDVIIAETKTGNKVSVFGFGTFSPVERAARTGRNPQTGAKVKIKASKAVRFAPASSYKEELNSKRKAVVKPLVPVATKTATAVAAPAPPATRTKTAAATEAATATRTARAVPSAKDTKAKIAPGDKKASLLKSSTRPTATKTTATKAPATKAPATKAPATKAPATKVTPAKSLRSSKSGKSAKKARTGR